MAEGNGQTAGDPAPQSSLRLRILSAVVLAPIVLGAVWAGGIWFTLLLAVAGPIMAFEWARLVLPEGSGPEFGGLATSVLLYLLFANAGAYDLGIVAAFCVALLATSLSLWLGRDARLPLFGFAYVGLSVIAFSWLRADPAFGLLALIWLLGVVWATDIFAYVAGRSIGGAKMAPKLSPNKTWAGLIGGVAGAILVGALVGIWLQSNWVILALISAGLAVFSQAGDVVESSLKRRAGVKDSGSIIPGHGGILDRVDGLMFAAVGAALIGMARGGWAEGVLVWP